MGDNCSGNNRGKGFTNSKKMDKSIETNEAIRDYTANDRNDDPYVKMEHQSIQNSLKEPAHIKTYESLFFNSPYSIFFLSVEGIIIDVNPAAEKLMEFPKKEMLGRHYRFFLDEADIAYTDDYFNKAIKGEALSFQITSMNKTGKRLALHCTYIPIENNDVIQGVHGIVQDYTTLLESEEKYRRLVENSLFGVYIIQNGRFILANACFCEMLGFDKEQDIIGQRASDFIYKQDIEEVNNFFNKSILVSSRQNKESQLQSRLVDRNGNVLHVEIYGAVIQYEGERAFTGTVINKTEQVKMEEDIEKQKKELVLSKYRYQALVKNSYDVVSIANKDGIITYQSPTGEKVLGYKASERVGKSIFELVHPEDREYMETLFRAILKDSQDQLKFHVKLQHADGSWRLFEVVGNNLLNEPSVAGIVFNYFDVTEMNDTKQQLIEAYYYDSLTSLPNRNKFESILKEMLEYSKKNKKQFVLMFLDLDRFKLVNDTLGHSTGDELIKKVAKRIRNTIGSGSFFGRQGGDEFVILLPESSLDEATAVAKKILHSFQESFILNDYEINITTSIGICLYPDSGEDKESLTKNADIAMYRAKENGTNSYEIFSSKMDVGTYKTFTLVNSLRKAITNNELTLLYQPIVSTESKEIVGSEALVRWNHPTWGMISPAEFIPLAENNGLIIPLGNWVLRKACEQNKLWQKQGLTPIKISVNFSTLQLLQADLYETVSDILEETEMNPRFLVIEITENILLNENKQTLQAIQQLKDLGVKFAIDDFGTGYSSIMYLRNLDIDILKIDQSFMKEIEKSENQDIFSTLVNLAMNLNLDVVVEGVESKEQFSIVNQFKCREVQGYYFSRPIPPMEFQYLLFEGVTNSAVLEQQAPYKPLEEKDRRAYSRIEFSAPLKGHMTIQSIGEKKVNIGNTKILIENISAGGLRFMSDIQLPVRRNIKIKIGVQLVDEYVEQLARIVWRNEEDNGMKQYGIEFLIDDEEREHLQQKLSILANEIDKK
ncbi:EAL domain-containing protein [Evansella sp. AB-P1]|uniref:EAL domain-containing protein n=1 Tax=Evansella sp. AB-P1 TaxID=3037653 RepID=UPI00241E76AB|nr:EAL domain-containing protein [Evansella sp. AB-P1]MDG5786715.1 EAL domain-containing protein [Evansella sp. AB-P1]